jgi:hypothetical protein
MTNLAQRCSVSTTNNGDNVAGGYLPREGQEALVEEFIGENSFWFNATFLHRTVRPAFRLTRDSVSLVAESRRVRNSMLAGILIATSATIALFLGLAHIYLTFFTRAFAARDAILEEKLKSVSPRISGQTTMWRAGVGFHASHALGVIFFGLVYGYLALAERDFLIRLPSWSCWAPSFCSAMSSGEALLV